MKNDLAAKGRGAIGNPPNRFDSLVREAAEPDWPGDLDEVASIVTQVAWHEAKSAISHNRSPDIYFSQSINPYHGCEHGCIYCYARPSHAYWGYSAGLDFESKLVARHGLATRLRAELAAPGYRCVPICFGANTDCYQPVERRLKLMPALLEIMLECLHPMVIITKGALIERDLEWLSALAARQLLQVYVSITTLDGAMARQLEPRAASPQRRLRLVEVLRGAGVPVGVLVAPVIPAINDDQMEGVLAAASKAGALSASYVLLRLPREVKTLFEEWLARFHPLKAAHVMSLMRQMYGGRAYDSAFDSRMRGEGPLAELIRQRFELACRRAGLSRRRLDLDCSRFQPPEGAQLRLF